MKKLLVFGLFLIITSICLAQTIYEIQYTTDPSGDSPYAGQTVTTSGIVTGVGYGGSNSTFFISMPAGGPWCGLYIYTADIEPLLGDEVEVTGEVSEYYGFTEIGYGTATVLSSGNPLPDPTQITTLQLSAEEAYESVLTQINNVAVTVTPNSYGEWFVDDGTGECQIDNGFYTYEPINVGDQFISITGLVDYSFDQYSLNPRENADFIPDDDLNPPEILSVVAINETTIEVTFSEEVEETSAENTANYSIVARDVIVENAELNLTNPTIVTLTVSGMTIGAYTITIDGVEDLSGNAMDNVSFDFYYAVAAQVGDVVINEVGEPYEMPNTWQDSYLELYNTTAAPIDVSGWLVWSIDNAADATASFEFPSGTFIEPDGFLIATRDKAMFLADYGTYINVAIVPDAANTTGTGVYIAANYYFKIVSTTALVIDSTSVTIVWNSLVHEKTVPTANGGLDENWYLTYQFDPVQGTPGQPNSQEPPPVPYTIYQLQTEDHDGEYVITSGIVTAAYDGFCTIQDGAGNYSGIWIENPDAGINIGDELEVIGTVNGEPNDDNTFILATSSLVISTGNPLPAEELLSTGDATLSPWDGVLVKVIGPCDNENPDEPEDYGEWTVDDGTGSIRIDDLGYLYEPTLSIFYEVTGPRYYSFGNVKIEPRDENDVLIYSPPEPASNPTPEHEAINVSINTDLSWTNGNNTELIDLYFGNVNPPPLILENNAPIEIYDPGTLDYEETYFWKVVCKNIAGNSTADIWSFTTEIENIPPPDPATDPDPEDGAIDVSYETDLSWTNGANTNLIDLYFGNVNPPPLILENNAPIETYDPGTLDYEETYYWKIVCKNDGGSSTAEIWSFTTEIEVSSDGSIPSVTTLIGNFPNPFNPSTTISYQLAKSSLVELSIFNLKGRLIKTLVNEFKDKGQHSIIWNAEEFSSGIYFYQLKTSENNLMKTMLLIK